MTLCAWRRTLGVQQAALKHSFAAWLCPGMREGGVLAESEVQPRELDEPGLCGVQVTVSP